MDRVGGKVLIRGLALLLCAVMLCTGALPAFAEDAASPEGLIDPAALQEMTEKFLREQGIPADRIGIGFSYPATGEDWFFNPDTWFYPASMYKVPLMMELSEKLSTGEIDERETIAGAPLDTLYNYIIVNSNNDYAHSVRNYLGGDEVWREKAKEYAGLEEYDSRYMDYCYFSPRYTTYVLKTLYAEPERFPKMLDNMLLSQQAHYFRLADEMHAYPIAQKYGSYSDMEGTDWNHNCGIIYTPQPFILTVMTKNVPKYEWVIGHFALLFTEYVLSLDEVLPDYQEEMAAIEAAEAAEQARLEAERLEAERREAERLEAERQRIIEEREAQERASQWLSRSLVLTGAGVVLLGLLSALLLPRYKKKKRYEQYRRRFEQELRQEALERKRRRP